MKWSIVGLLFLGIVAALCATLLVSSLLAGVNRRTRPAEAPTHVEVMVATRALPAMTMVRAGDVISQKVPVAEASTGYLGSAVQVVGKVLAVPLVEGQAFHKGCFADEGSGIYLAAALPDGMRAVSVSLSSYSGLLGLLYPGSLVDVMVSFQPPGNTAQNKDAISITLLEGVEVLAIENRTVMSKEEQVTPSALQSLRSGGQVMVTLMVDSRQAKALQLAMQYGSVTLAMRNPMDARPAEGGITLLSDLAASHQGIAPAAQVIAAVNQPRDQLLDSITRMFADQDAQPPSPPQRNVDDLAMRDVHAMAASGFAQRRPAFWETTVIRGVEIEKSTFPLPEQGVQP